MTALDKVLALSKLDSAVAAAQPEEDTAGELVKAAMGALAGVRVYLAGGDDDEDESDDSGDDEGGDGGGHASHSTFKALRRKNVPAARAKNMCAQADKRVKAAAAVEAAVLALSGLAVPGGDLVEATALDTWSLAARGAGKTWASEAYADPGFLGGRKRFLVDTEEHTRLTLAHLCERGHTEGYTGGQLAAVEDRARAAAARFGLRLGHGDRAAAASLLDLLVLTAAERETAGLAGEPGLEKAAELVALAGRPVGDGGVIMNHGSFTGKHSHSHFQSQVHDHEHQHFGDNSHEGGPAHRQGSKPGGRAGW